MSAKNIAIAPVIGKIAMYTALGGIAFIGMLPIPISLVFVGAMFGRPAPCMKAPCMTRLYGGELVVYPIGTGLPMVSGLILGYFMRRKKNEQ